MSDFKMAKDWDQWAQNLLERIVLIDSGSQNVSGVNAVQDILSQKLQELSFECRRIPNPMGSQKSGDLLVASHGDARATQWVTLVCHSDTVYELESCFSGYKIDQNQKYAMGPGVIDNKGGVVVALTGVAKFLDQCPETTLGIRVVVSPNEEVGSIGFHEIFKEFGERSDVVLGFEPAFEDGSFVNRRQGNRWYSLKITGREAHSGREHAYGLNAAVELAEKIVRLTQLTDYSVGTTLSVGRIEGGQDKFNIVCGEALAKIDLRFEDPALGALVDKKITEILSTPYTKSAQGGFVPHCHFELEDNCPPFKNSKESDLLAETLRTLIEKIEGRKVPEPKRGAAADTSYMSREGLIILDGLGPVGSGMHQSSERILLSSLKSRSDVCAALLKTLLS